MASIKGLLAAAAFLVVLTPDIPLRAQGTHDHGSQGKTRAVPANAPAPSLTVTAEPKSADRSTWLLTLTPQNFRFIPMTKNIPSSVNEGHAHLYLNGKKLGRIHTTTYELKNVPPGTHRVRAVLSTNGHEEILSKGQPVAGTVTITRP
jgi:hypothetical protein